MLTHRNEVPGNPDKSRFVDLYPEREAYARSRLGFRVRYCRPRHKTLFGGTLVIGLTFGASGVCTRCTRHFGSV